MKYSEAMEFARLLDFEPDKAYANTFKRAMEAEEAFKSQMALESTFGAFVDDTDNMRDENIAVATEAANAVTNALGKIANWFKNLLTRFKAMIRRIVFKSRTKTFQKAMKKVSASGKNAGSTAPIKAMVVELNDEEKKSYTEILNAAGITVNLNKVDAASLANIGKQVMDKSSAAEKELDAAMKNPNPNVTVKDINAKCKACAKAMKVTTSLLNKAVKAGAVQTKDGSGKADKTEPSSNSSKEEPAEQVEGEVLPK